MSEGPAGKSPWSVQCPFPVALPDSLRGCDHVALVEGASCGTGGEHSAGVGGVHQQLVSTESVTTLIGAVARRKDGSVIALDGNLSAVGRLQLSTSNEGNDEDSAAVAVGATSVRSHCTLLEVVNSQIWTGWSDGAILVLDPAEALRGGHDTGRGNPTTTISQRRMWGRFHSAGISFIRPVSGSHNPFPRVAGEEHDESSESDDSKATAVVGDQSGIVVVVGTHRTNDGDEEEPSSLVNLQRFRLPGAFSTSPTRSLPDQSPVTTPLATTLSPASAVAVHWPSPRTGCCWIAGHLGELVTVNAHTLSCAQGNVSPSRILALTPLYLGPSTFVAWVAEDSPMVLQIRQTNTALSRVASVDLRSSRYNREEHPNAGNLWSFAQTRDEHHSFYYHGRSLLLVCRSGSSGAEVSVLDLGLMREASNSQVVCSVVKRISVATPISRLAFSEPLKMVLMIPDEGLLVDREGTDRHRKEDKRPWSALVLHFDVSAAHRKVGMTMTKVRSRSVSPTTSVLRGAPRLHDRSGSSDTEYVDSVFRAARVRSRDGGTTTREDVLEKIHICSESVADATNKSAELLQRFRDQEAELKQLRADCILLSTTLQELTQEIQNQTELATAARLAELNARADLAAFKVQVNRSHAKRSEADSEVHRVKILCQDVESEMNMLRVELGV